MGTGDSAPRAGCGRDWAVSYTPTPTDGLALAAPVAAVSRLWNRSAPSSVLACPCRDHYCASATAELGGRGPACLQPPWPDFTKKDKWQVGAKPRGRRRNGVPLPVSHGSQAPVRHPRNLPREPGRLGCGRLRMPGPAAWCPGRPCRNARPPGLSVSAPTHC